MAPRKTSPMLADGGPVGEFQVAPTPVDERRQAITETRAAGMGTDTISKIKRSLADVEKAAQDLEAQEKKNASNPFAGETGWRNMSYGWTADNRLIQEIVGNSGKILGYVYADTGQKADPSAVIPGKVVTPPATMAPMTASQQAAAGEANMKKSSAKAALQAWLSSFFDPQRDADTISKLMSFVNSQVEQDVPSDAIMLNIRSQDFYKQRFAGNEGRRAAGLAELTPAEYLAAESTYDEILQSAGLGNLSTRSNFAKLISGRVSAKEAQDRVTNVYSRIANADTALRSEIRRLNQFGNITAADFAESLLTGKEGAASLQRKITQAEISTEFTQRGLTSATGIEELERLGVDRAKAASGAEYAARGTRRLQDLATIYGVQSEGIQQELESEAFRGLESQRRKLLVSQERAAAAGRAGTGTTSLTTSASGTI